LAGDARDERASHHCKATRTLNQVPSSDVVVVAGGVGAARFLRALRLHDADARVTAIVNTGDDTVVNGLHVSPDIDTVTYTLADAIDPVRGWGLRDETWTAMESLRRYTAQDAASVKGGGAASRVNDWFNLGDRDLATHLYRTARLAGGATLSEVTAEIAQAWGVRARIVPMSNDRVATRVTLDEDATASDGFAYRAGDTVSFQEYFVRLRHAVAVRSVEFDGAASAAALGLDELRSTATVVIAPSNPVVSIGPVRALRGVDDALAARRDSVVGISPIIGGAALKGPADRMLRELGHEASALGVARMYAPVCGAFVVDTADAALRDQIEALGMRCIVTDTIMKDDRVGRALAATVLKVATSTVRR
jgi:LPPG:FO 2-phospho-L-lactate transferase